MTKKRGNDYPAKRQAPSVPGDDGRVGDHFDGFLPDAPRHLDRLAKKMFDQMAKELITSGILRRVDVPVLGEVAQALSDIDRWTKEIRKEGEIKKGPNGGDVWNPKLGLLKDARKRLEVFGDRLGLNPKLRSSIKFPEGEAPAGDEAESDQLELFVRGESWNRPDPEPGTGGEETG
jgi:P27 family predicted phage terminase small subunit